MRMRCVIALSAAILVSRPGSSQEYFGKFPDPLKGEFVEAKPRPKFRLNTEFRFDDPNNLLWSVPPNEEVDGASK